MQPSRTTRALGPVLAVAGIACAPVATAGPGCAPRGPAVVLPDALSETSGASVSRRDPRAIWTHNDEGSALYAIDEQGRILSEHRLPLRLRDWEDLAVADCPGGSCLYLADTGDNAERRSGGDVRIIRVPEPDPSARRTGEAPPLEAPSSPSRSPKVRATSKRSSFSRGSASTSSPKGVGTR